MSAALLQAENLGLSIRGKSVFEGIGFSLAAGEILALLGPNGSGKSSLLRVLVGADRATEGAVRVMGAPVERMDAAARARAITLVVDDYHPDFPLSVTELVALGRIAHRGVSRAGEDARAISEALRMARLDELAARPVGQLSSGERQRAHLARALAQATPVLLLDEPTSNLDIRSQLELSALLCEHATRGGAVVVAVHDIALAFRFAHRALLLSRGRPLAIGAVEDVLTEANLSGAFGARIVPQKDPSGRVTHLDVALES